MRLLSQQESMKLFSFLQHLCWFLQCTLIFNEHKFLFNHHILTKQIVTRCFNDNYNKRKH